MKAVRGMRDIFFVSAKRVERHINDIEIGATVRLFIPTCIFFADTNATTAGDGGAFKSTNIHIPFHLCTQALTIRMMNRVTHVKLSANTLCASLLMHADCMCPNVLRLSDE